MKDTPFVRRAIACCQRGPIASGLVCAARPWMAVLALLLLVGGAPVAAQVITHPQVVAHSPVRFAGKTEAFIDWPLGFYDENVAGEATFFVATALDFAPDGRIFVAEKSGLVYVIENGVKHATPFLDLEAEVLDNRERGVLGLTLDPDFAQNGHLYLVYTVDHERTDDSERFDAFGRLVRYSASAADPNMADPASRKVLIGETFAEGFPACWVAHSPNALRWGTDGTLLISAGDGASYNTVPPDEGGLYPPCFEPGKLDPAEDIGSFRAQSLDSYGGKILRIDPETGLGVPSNPFFTGNPDDKASRVWSYGLRNPFRFAVRQNGSTDPADGQPGTLFIGDVGWDEWEDVHLSRTGGENFGWPCYEGPEENPLHQSTATAATYCGGAALFDAPALYWHHQDDARSSQQDARARSITMGEFYAGKKYPASYQGQLFYADFMEIWIRTAAFDDADQMVSEAGFATATFQMVDFRYNPHTEHLYYLMLNPANGEGQVRRIRHAEGDANLPPVARIDADVLSGALPLTVTFSGSNATDPNEQALTYLWDFGNGDTSAEPNPTYTFFDDGYHTVTLTVTDPFNVAATTEVEVVAGTATARESDEVPDGQPTLAPAFPNPFADQTTIGFSLPRATEVEVSIYDVLGRRLRRLAAGYQPAGPSQVRWDGRDADGAAVPNGLYFYQLRIGGYLLATRSAVLVR